MTQDERLLFLIDCLKKESAEYSALKIPDNFDEKKTILRALVNMRKPSPVSDEFIAVENEFLQGEQSKKNIATIDKMTATQQNIYLWKGDITALKVDAIVNAANSAALGCFVPCHNCIDNIIHTNAGVQLRLECDKVMKERGTALETGDAIITGAYNLPSKFVIHTVGPIISGSVTKKDKDALSQCYRTCLSLCKERAIKSIAFCCISTGVFHFPNKEAAEVAIEAVRDFVQKNRLDIKIVFNVFKEVDYEIYKRLLG